MMVNEVTNDYGSYVEADVKCVKNNGWQFMAHIDTYRSSQY